MTEKVYFVAEHYGDNELAEANDILATTVARLQTENDGLRELVRELLHVSAYECEGCRREVRDALRPPHAKCGANCQLIADARKLGVEV